MEQIYDVAVLGGGPGGYTAALYCARAGLSTVVLEKLSPGGQMATTSNVENYPGFAEGVDGFDLAMQMKDGAERFGVETLFADATAVALEGGVKTITTSSGESNHCKAEQEVINVLLSGKEIVSASPERKETCFSLNKSSQQYLISGHKSFRSNSSGRRVRSNIRE